MEYEPRAHQILADKFIREHDKGALFLDMGLGKTVVMLTHIDRLIHEEFAIHNALVIAPKRVAEDTWSREQQKWNHLQHLKVVKIMGTPKQRLEALHTEADVYVTNRENVPWLVEQTEKDFPFDLVCIDELSSFKTASSKRWKALRKVIFTCKFVYGLTGTPAPNGYMDLWPQIYLFDAGERLDRTLSAYRAHYFYPVSQNGHIVYKWGLRAGAQSRIDARLRDLCLSMSKEDWLEMPEIIYNTIPVAMDRKARQIYDKFKQDKVLPLVKQSEGLALSGMDDAYSSAVVGSMAATVTNKLLQMSNGAVYDEDGEVFHIHDAKIEALHDVIDEAQGQPIMVFYNYKHDLDRILKAFPQAVKLDGSETIDAWNRGNIPLLLAQPMSAGHGLNLQAGGHIIVWFGLPWSLELYQQANNRLHRMGQEHTVIVHHLVCANTLDERVMSVLSQKDSTQSALLNALKQYIKENV